MRRKARTAATRGSLQAERRLRERLADNAIATLRIEQLVNGLMPPPGSGLDRSPDLVLLAPEKEGFTSCAATHGSFAYPLLRVPMLFCGPAVRADTEIAAADMVDFTPTILSLLGVAPTDELDGRARLDYYDRPLRSLVSRPRLPVFQNPILLASQNGDVPTRRNPAPVRLGDRVDSATGVGDKDFVVLTLHGGGSSRTMDVVADAFAVDTAADDASAVAVQRIAIRLPHVPGWLSEMLSHAVASAGVGLRHADYSEEVVLDAATFCGLVNTVSDRLTVAAMERASEAVTHNLARPATNDLLGDRLQAAWASVQRAFAAPSSEERVIGSSISLAADVATECGDEVLSETLAALAALGLRAPIDTSEEDPIGVACEVIERLLGASDVGTVLGLRWS